MKYLLVGNSCNNSDYKFQLKSFLLAHPYVDMATIVFPAEWGDEPLWK
jgi:hypothetical protein